MSNHVANAVTSPLALAGCGDSRHGSHPAKFRTETTAEIEQCAGTSTNLTDQHNTTITFWALYKVGVSITYPGNDHKNGGGSAGASLDGSRGGYETSSGGSMAARTPTPQGRPPGYKNKPKPPVKETKSAM